MFFKKIIRDAELAKVPTVRENGTTDVGKSQFSNGTKIKLAPPPQIALIQNAIIVAKKSNVMFKIISKSYFQAMIKSPPKINVAPMPIFHVNCSCKNKNESKSVIKILALSINATSDTFPILMAL